MRQRHRQQTLDDAGASRRSHHPVFVADGTVASCSSFCSSSRPPAAAADHQQHHEHEQPNQQEGQTTPTANNHEETWWVLLCEPSGRQVWDRVSASSPPRRGHHHHIKDNKNYLHTAAARRAQAQAAQQTRIRKAQARLLSQHAPIQDECPERRWARSAGTASQDAVYRLLCAHETQERTKQDGNNSKRRTRGTEATAVMTATTTAGHGEQGNITETRRSSSNQCNNGKEHRDATSAPFIFEPCSAFVANGLGSRALRCMQKGMHYFASLQCRASGHWPAAHGGPAVLPPMLVIACYICNVPHDIFVDQTSRDLIIRRMLRYQLSDGGWGLHPEDGSRLSVSVLSYVALRLLGLSSHQRSLARARRFIHTHGGALFAPSWCKFWLCLLGVYEWTGIDALLPEAWILLPRFLHPSRRAPRMRVLHACMTYCYGHRVVSQQDKDTGVIAELRTELYRHGDLTKKSRAAATTNVAAGAYDGVPFSSHRGSVAPMDLTSPPSYLYRMMSIGANVYERICAPRALRKRALQSAYRFVCEHDESTSYLGVDPICKFLSMVVRWHGDSNAGHHTDARKSSKESTGSDSSGDGGGNPSNEAGKSTPSVAMQHHTNRLDDYLWLAEDGLGVQCGSGGGSQLWDVAHTVLAFVETRAGYSYARSLQRAYHFLEVSQCRASGGWPMSTRQSGLITSHSTALALSAVLRLHSHNLNKSPGVIRDEQRDIRDVRIYKAVGLLLRMQDGFVSDEDDTGVVDDVRMMRIATSTKARGWSRYLRPDGDREIPNALAWAIDLLHPDASVMESLVDAPDLVCTAVCVRALAHFHMEYPRHRTVAVRSAIRAGTSFILASQDRSNGGWLATGRAAMGFAYGTWVALEAISVAHGVNVTSESSSLAMASEAAQVTRTVVEDELVRQATRRAHIFLRKQQRLPPSAVSGGGSTNSNHGDGGWGENFRAVRSRMWVDHADSQVVHTAWATLALLTGPGAHHEAVFEHGSVRAGISFLVQQQQESGDWPAGCLTGIYAADCICDFACYRNVFSVMAIGRYLRFKARKQYSF